MHSRPPQPVSPPRLVDPHLFGTACGLFAAFVYTGANAFLRAVNDCDPVWVSAMKAVPTTVLMGPVLLIMYVRGQRVFPTLPLVAAMSVGGLVGQLGGNISFQWALGQIGVALTVPLSLGGMILAAAIFGRVFLGEPVTAKAALALALLLASIFVLSFGARGASVSVARQLVPGWQLAAGVAAACLSGVAYAVLNVILRYCVLRGTPLPATLFTVSATGLVALTSLSWLKIGHTGILATAPSDLALMLAAGLCNTVAFVSLTKSLQLTSVVYVNALNATQATMAALAGVLIFGESLSPWLTLGVALTISGLGCLAWAHQAMRSAPPEEDRPWNGETLQSAPQPEIEGK